MDNKKWIITIAAVLVNAIGFAQGFTVSGSLKDAKDNSSLIGVTITLSSANDPSQSSGAATDLDGHFSISNIVAGSYTLKASYIGYQNYEKTISVNGNTDLGNIVLTSASTQLKGVEVAAQQIAAQQAGDTSNFNAGAYKTNPDANAEDLINKMPGISTDGGTVKAQGEDVKQVLVDGKPFFGDDPNAAIKNLPAEIIDRIQVFDKLSDQAQLTGIDDGQSQKTINIITKPGKNNGQFGKLFGGYGTDGRYMAGGSVNYFKGDTRVSLIGLFNNVNQQNFSTDDLLGVVGTSSGQSRGGSGGAPRGGGGSPRGGGSSGGGDYRGGSGGSDASSFLVGQQGGISTTNSVGLNYSDNWGKKVKVTGSYFFNSTKNDLSSDLSRTYLTQSDTSFVYKETNISTSTNTNHRANLRLEYEIDSSNSLIITPKISFQDNSSNRFITGNQYRDSTLTSSTNNRNVSNNQGYNFNNNILFRHKFAKRGRTISLNLGTTYNDRTGDGDLHSEDQYTEDIGGLTGDTLDQHYTTSSTGYTLSGSLNYTEPLSQKSQLMINYSPSYNNSKTERRTTNIADDNIDDDLSNTFDNTYITQRGGLTYRTNTAKSNFSAGVNYQYASLDGKQTYPTTLTVDKTFSTLLPQIMYNYRFTRTKNLRLMYRANNNAPSITQLQNVLDNGNPLLLRTGNADLQQDYQHTLVLRYGATNTTTSRNFFAVAFGNFTQDYIGNATYFPVNEDSITVSDIVVKRGAQLTRPVNLDGYWSGRTFFTYGMPIKKIKSNLNLNAGFNYNRIPALINNDKNLANNYTVNGGFVLGSNISENVDFTLAYTGNYNVVKNSIQAASDNTYYNQTTSLKFNWIFLNGFVLNTNINHNLYTGLGEGYNQSYFLWNASFGYKFLKDKSLDVRVTAYDLLKQNRAIERTVTESYIEDSHTQVLQQYFMLNITYTLRKFGSASAAPSNSDNTDRPGRRGGRGGDDRQGPPPRF